MTSKRRENFWRLIKPSSIVFIGGEDASVAIREAERRGFSGDIYAVNPSRDNLAGYSCFSSVSSLPKSPDAVFLAIPSKQILVTVKERAKIKAGGIVCYAAGFKEIGLEGALLEKELIEALGEMVMIGPNCYGIINYLHRSALWPFAHGGSSPGYGAAIITQSGMLSSDITMSQRSLPLTHMISLGNQASLTSSELIDYLLDEKEVRAFGLHVEEIDDVREFERSAYKALALGKPLVVLKTGSSSLGADLTKSHTGSYAGSFELYKAFFKRLGIIQVDTPSELIETLKFICISGIPNSKKCFALTCSGGGATMVADLGEREGFVFPKLNEEATKSISELLPAIATVSNPLDYTTPIWGKKEYTYPLFLRILELIKPDFSILVQDYPLKGLDETKVNYLTDGQAFARACEEHNLPGAVISTISENMDLETRNFFLELSIAPLQGLAEGIKAIHKTCQWGIERTEKLAREQYLLFDDLASDKVKNLDEWTAKKFLAQNGIKSPVGQRCIGDEVIVGAQSIGYPVVLKLLSENILHKTEFGAVALNIEGENELKKAVGRMKKISGLAGEEVITKNYLIERMMPKPICEVIIGIKKDSQLIKRS